MGVCGSISVSYTHLCTITYARIIFNTKNTFFIKLYKICERLFSRIKLPDGNKKAAIPMLRGIYRPASALLLLYFILLLLYYLVARISFIWLTSPSQSIPCTMHASSRLSPWADGHPRPVSYTHLDVYKRQGKDALR